MSQLTRFGVSLEDELLDQFDKLINKKNYPNRSEALRDLIRQELVAQEWQENKEIAGAITLIFDHHKRELVNKLTEIQHDFQKIIISTQHIHLDHDNCLETVILKGLIADVQEFADSIMAVRGVRHGNLHMVAVEEETTSHSHDGRIHSHSKPKT